jgi:hypothetical protein
MRDYQPGHQRGQPEQHDHGEAESAERIAHLPVVFVVSGLARTIPVNSRTRPIRREAM